MWVEKALSKMSVNATYNREDLYRLFLREKPNLSDSTFRWTLYSLQQQQKLYKKSFDTYSILKQQEYPVYRPKYSERANDVVSELEERFPELQFVVFESVLLNEFLNHQIGQNTIYVQVEKDVSSYIFDVLQEKYTGSVLYKPSKAEFDRYWTRDCIVVLDLISQAPLSAEHPHEITIEKMLVDLIAERSIAATFSPAELLDIFANVMSSYQVDRRKTNRYAGRRGKAEKIKKYLGGED